MFQCSIEACGAGFIELKVLEHQGTRSLGQIISEFPMFLSSGFRVFCLSRLSDVSPAVSLAPWAIAVACTPAAD